MPVLTLCGGPFDGDTMQFQPEQRAVVVPESIDGALHRYEVAADGRAYYAAPVSEGHVESLARALYDFYVDETADGDTSEWNPWELLDDEQRSYSRRQALYLIGRVEPELSASSEGQS